MLSPHPREHLHSSHTSPSTAASGTHSTALPQHGPPQPPHVAALTPGAASCPRRDAGPGPWLAAGPGPWLAAGSWSAGSVSGAGAGGRGWLCYLLQSGWALEQLHLPGEGAAIPTELLSSGVGAGLLRLASSPSVLPAELAQ